MRGIAIYLEGGGDSAAGRSAIRQGMGEFLKEIRNKARGKSISWKVTACGSRNEAFDRFRNADEEWLNCLLVDSEGPVTESPQSHLREQDSWDTSVHEEDRYHLMVQTMETWIVSDPETLELYYGQGFRKGILPQAANLENVSKGDVERKLAEATRDTTKGRYDKISHARVLLSRIDPIKVRQRCPHCDRLFTTLEKFIEAAP